MSLKNKNKAYYYALVCTISSVLGGIAGYFIGYYAYDVLLPFMQEMDYMDMLERARVWFDIYGVWVIAIAGFSPVPYKIFTITAGVLSMHLVPFIAMSMLSRGARYFLVSFLVKRYGDRCDKWLQKYIDRLGYALIVVVIIGVWYAQ
jgi:membrane protein YqaA with SNARE-associated domain